MNARWKFLLIYTRILSYKSYTSQLIHSLILHFYFSFLQIVHSILILFHSFQQMKHKAKSFHPFFIKYF